MDIRVINARYVLR